jgi:hypothetical protein
MRHVNIPFGVATATEIARQNLQRPDRIVGPTDFYKCAKVLWPLSTAADLAVIGRASTRTAERWLSGEIEPPNAIVIETMRRLFGPRADV